MQDDCMVFDTKMMKWLYFSWVDHRLSILIHTAHLGCSLSCKIGMFLLPSKYNLMDNHPYNVTQVMGVCS